MAAICYSTTNEFLALAGRRKGIHQCILHSDRHDPRIKISDRNVADAMEAILGAVYIDPGEKNMQEIMSNLGLFKFMDQELPDDVKERIILHSRGPGIPYPPPETTIPGEVFKIITGNTKARTQLKKDIQTRSLA